ncbi:MAG: TolC family protein, partial [Porphyromonadaceae bacterium]|nr:TolC family protein [Porphyromonadaceae bacterium]
MKKLWSILGLCIVGMGFLSAQQVTLDLQHVIALANDSSLQAFRNRNLYLTGFWEYRSYKANRLPSFTLNLVPSRYNRYITERYDSEINEDVYREQQRFSAGASLTIEQNVDFTGGKFYLETDLDFMRNFGVTTSTQFSTVPIRIGYSQSLIGYNDFHWEKKIEPIRYEKVKRQYVYNSEQVSEDAVTYFFSLAMAQSDYDMALSNVETSDTLYRIGLERYKIASIEKSDLLTLELDMVNARNSLDNAQVQLDKAMYALVSFLNLPKGTRISLILPLQPRILEISIEKAVTCAKENNPVYYEQKQTVLEAEQTVDLTRKQSRFNASVNASVGLNQVSNRFGDAYHNPFQQEIVSLSLSIPLIDWGVARGKYNMAKNELNVANISFQQEMQSIEQEVIVTVNEFNLQQKILTNATQALR